MSSEIYPASSVSSPVRGLAYTVIKQPGFNTIVQGSPNFNETRLAQTRNPRWRWTLTYEVLFNRLNQIGLGLTYTDLQTLIGFFCSRSGQYDYFLFDDPDDNSVGPGVLTSGWTANIWYPLNSSLLIAGRWQKATVGGVSGATTPAFSTSGGHVHEGPSSPQLTWTDQGSGYTQAPNLWAGLDRVLDSSSGLYYSPIQRNIGGFYEDITDLNILTVTPTFYANGVTMVSGASPGGQYSLSSIPGIAIPGYSYMGQYITWNNGYTPATPITATFKFYFRVRFEMDEVDFEKFVSDLWTVGGSEGKGGAGAIKLISVRPATI